MKMAKIHTRSGRQSKILLLAAVLCGILNTGWGSASDEVVVEMVPQPKPTDAVFSASISGEAQYTPAASIRDGGTGDLSVTEVRSNLVYTSISEKRFLQADLNYSYGYYNFSTFSPFKHLQNFGAIFMGREKFNEAWSLMAIGAVNWGAEAGASLDEGFNYSIMVGPSYQITDDINLYAGVYFRSRLQDQDLLIGIGGIDWRINDRLRLRTYNGAALSYDLFGDKHTFVELSGEYRISQYAVNPRAPGFNRAVHERTVASTLAISHRFNESFAVRGFVEGQFLRRYQFRENGNSTNNFKMDNGFSFGIAGTFAF